MRSIVIHSLSRIYPIHFIPFAICVLFGVTQLACGDDEFDEVQVKDSGPDGDDDSDSTVIPDAGPDGGEDTDDEVDVDITPDSLCREIAEVMCHNMFQCCTKQEIFAALGLEISTNMSDCQRDMTLRCRNQTASLYYALDNGTVTMDSELANACYRSMLAPENTCFEITTDPNFFNQCTEPWSQGVQVTDEPCRWDFQCSTDHYCAPNLKCRALPTNGQPCNQSGTGAPCATGLYCGIAAEGGQPVCTPFQEAGQPCTPTMLCEPESYCEGLDPLDPLVSGTCREKKPIDAVCEKHMDCESNYCIPGICDDGRACYETAECQGYCDGTIGGECASDDDCVGSCTLSGSVCDEASDCPGICDESATSCDQDDDCPGICSLTPSTSCDSDTDCTEEDDVCVHETCLENSCEQELCVDSAGTCNGQPVCGFHPYEINYCQVGLSIIPNFPDYRK